MDRLSIRDLQRISGDAIQRLDGPVPIKSGTRTVALLIPMKRADPARLEAILREAQEMSKGRDAAADDAALAPFGPVDPTYMPLEDEPPLREVAEPEE